MKGEIDVLTAVNAQFIRLCPLLHDLLAEVGGVSVHNLHIYRCWTPWSNKYCLVSNLS